mmetsp:Transcript_5607/g.9990  ORF Transcript_5607/g.9990 Transcript_5607/m.9990 type:complete len:527 (+) Transcript_5607:1183-2763(+)
MAASRQQLNQHALMHPTKQNASSSSIQIWTLAFLVLSLALVIQPASAQISWDTTPREPLPLFAQFPRLASARGQANIDTFSFNNTFTAQQTVGYNSPIRTDGFAWGTWANNLASSDPGLGLSTVNMVALSLGCGNNLSEPQTALAGDPGGTMGCFIDGNYDVGCVGFAYPSPLPAAGGTYFRISTGYDHACALSFDSQYVDLNTLLLYDPADRTAFKDSIALVCWGKESNEMDTSYSNFQMPLASTSSNPYMEVGCGFQITCVHTLNGRISCAGLNVYKTFRGNQTNEILIQTIVDLSLYNTNDYYGGFSVGPSNWCGVDTTFGNSGYLNCYGAGIVNYTNDNFTSLTYAHGLYTVGLGDTTVCALLASNNKPYCKVSPLMTFYDVLADRITDGCQANNIYQLVAGRDWCCTLSDSFFVGCYFDEDIDPSGVLFTPWEYNYFECVQNDPGTCQVVILTDETSPESWSCETQTRCVTGWKYQAGAPNPANCTQVQVNNYLYFSLTDPGGDPSCGPKIGYMADNILNQ